MKLIKKSLDELIKAKYDFYIPDYQRGYKWTEDEVFKLLNDIWDFKLKKSEDDGDFYCLQPVVVKPQNNRYYVIDGQQRLTTMLIIQQAIRDYSVWKDPGVRRVLDAQPELKDTLMPSISGNTYSIEYQTRNKSEVWLKNIRNEAEMRNNSDYYHIYKAYAIALEFLMWIDSSTDEKYQLLGKQCPSAKKKVNAFYQFESCFRSKCCVIWYELDEANDNDHEIFDRLNTGKIPLTNAELIKAMLLQQGNFPADEDTKVVSEDYRTSISRQWDDIENTLQNPFFWDFIYDADSVGIAYETRIEYLFDLLANKKKTDSDVYYFTFDYYDSLFQYYKGGGRDAIEFVNDQWKRVRELIQTLQDWYDNKTYYHYIGYLISQGKTVNEIINIQFPKNAKGETLPVVPKKDEFIKELEKLIREKTTAYTHDKLMKSKEGLTPTLLLFNVLTTLDNSDKSDRFPFHYYKQTVWNEEHVAPNTPFEPNNPARCFQFAAQMLEYYTDISYFEALDGLVADNLLKPKNERRKKSQLTTEAKNRIQKEYEAILPSMGEAKEICGNLLTIFKNDGKNPEDLSLSQKTFEEIANALGIKDATLNVEDDRRDYIWNQVLLDEGTNKSYGNAIFPYKRMRNIKNTSRGLFVPKGTYNVFVKAYSHRMTNMLEWDEHDALRYLAEIFKTLNRKGRNFLSEKLLQTMPDYVNENRDELIKLINNEQ